MGAWRGCWLVIYWLPAVLQTGLESWAWWRCLQRWRWTTLYGRRKGKQSALSGIHQRWSGLWLPTYVWCKWIPARRFGTLDSTIHNGVRWSAYNAYLKAGEVEKRENLNIHSSSFAERIVFEGTTAVGIDYTENNGKKTARATKDIILSGGAINSPQLLMLSGEGMQVIWKSSRLP